MQAYMKSAMPYHGVHTPELRRIVRSYRATPEEVMELWRTATHREERYAAIGLSRGVEMTWPQYDEMIVTGAWWDLVDSIATTRLWTMPDAKAVLLAYSTDENEWRRRSAIIAQVGRKSETDWEFLQAVIEPNRGDRSFWIRKAIGWALREYAKHEPERVAAYLAVTELSGLSRREAERGVAMGVSRAPGRARPRSGPARTRPSGRSPAPG